jgi:hypothetical protein
MKINSISQQQQLERYQEIVCQRRFDEARLLRQAEEKKKADQTYYDRVERARRLGLDKGQNVDIMA